MDLYLCKSFGFRSIEQKGQNQILNPSWLGLKQKMKSLMQKMMCFKSVNGDMDSDSSAGEWSSIH